MYTTKINTPARVAEVLRHPRVIAAFERLAWIDAGNEGYAPCDSQIVAADFSMFYDASAGDQPAPAYDRSMQIQIIEDALKIAMLHIRGEYVEYDGE